MRGASDSISRAKATSSPSRAANTNSCSTTPSIRPSPCMTVAAASFVPRKCGGDYAGRASTVMVALRRSGQLSGQVGQQHQMLRAGLQVLELDLAFRQLVADEDGEVGVLLRGGLELPGQLAVTKLRTDRQPLRAQEGRNPEARDCVGRVCADHDRQRRCLMPRGDARFVEGEQDTIEPQAEADGGCGSASEQLNKAVVAAATAERLLLSLGALAVELEGRAGVVVEASYKGWLQTVRNADCVEVCPDRREVHRARLAPGVGDLGRTDREGGHRRVLGIEQPKRIGLEPAPLQFGQLRFVSAEIGLELCQIGRPASCVADRVEKNLD